MLGNAKVLLNTVDTLDTYLTPFLLNFWVLESIKHVTHYVKSYSSLLLKKQ